MKQGIITDSKKSIRGYSLFQPWQVFFRNIIDLMGTEDLTDA
jgi:hypothetical protein